MAYKQKGFPMHSGISPMKQDQPKMGWKREGIEIEQGKARLKKSFGKQGFKENKTQLKNPNQSKINKLVKTISNLKDKGATIKGKNAISMRLRNVQNQINKLSGSKVKRGVVTGE